MATTGLFVFSLLFLCQALGQILEPSDPEFAGLICRSADSIEPHPDGCKDDRFVMCSEGSPFAVMRCGPTLVFNSNLGECTRKPQGYRKPGECRDPQTCDDVKYDGSYIAGLDCSYFTVCVQGEPVIRCTPGSYFKYEIQNCAWPGFGQITNAEIQTCRAIEGRITTPTTTTTTTPTTASSGTLNPCQGTSTGNVADQSNCARYYTCNNGSPVSINTCTTGTSFDAVRGTCDWTSLVQCGTRPQF